MGLKIDGGVLSAIPGTNRGQSFALYGLKSIGIWETEEITEDVGEGTVLSIAARLRAMDKANEKNKTVYLFVAPGGPRRKSTF